MDESALLDEIRRGQEAAQADRIHDAEQMFLKVLDASRGSGGEVELLACSSLVTVYSRENREFEALLMARRLVPIAIRRDEPWHLAKGLGAISAAFVGVEDWERAEAALVRHEEMLGAVPADQRDGQLIAVRGLQMEILLHRRDAAGSRAVWRDAEPVFRRTETMFEGWRRYRLLLEARVALLEDSRADLEPLLDEAERVPVPAAIGGLDLALLRVESARGAGDEAAQRRAVDAMLAELEEHGPARHGYSQTLRGSNELGTMLADDDRFSLAAVRAFDIAASCVLSRIAQLDACMKRLPELVPLHADDEVALRESRGRFRAHQKRLLQSVGALLTRKGPGALPPGLQGEFLHVCAWCERVRTEDGTWLPVGHFIPEVGVRVTHGICGKCRPRALHG